MRFLDIESAGIERIIDAYRTAYTDFGPGKILMMITSDYTKGYNTWFFIAVDNEAGISLQSGAEHFIQPAGGKVLGSARAPVGDLDFSSHLISAQASGAKVICFANAGTDLQNCIKQAEEFGITKNGTLLATLVLEVNDVISIGQDVCKGLVMATSFYWNQSPDTHTWSHRYMPKMGKPPSSGQACAYSATTHWLKAVQATGTLDGDAVAAKMRQTPVNGFFNKDVHIMPNGTVPHTMYVWLVQPSSEAKEKWDVFKPFATLPSPTAFPSPDAFGCPLAKA
jgi:branched-chain amino acid transport system substrate-binding protein